MLRYNDIHFEFLHLIGWQQHYASSEFVIANSLTQSDSGLFFQQAHPLLTLKNIKSVSPDFVNASYVLYSPTKHYVKGEVSKYNNIVYRALQPAFDKQPDTNLDHWEVFDSFSKWLEDKTIGCINQTITNFITKKALTSNTKSILLNKTLFSSTGRIKDTINKTNSLVGFELVPARSKGVTTKIEKIGLQFNGTGAFTLYVMHSSMSEPYREIEITITKANTFEWFPVTDLFLPFISDETNAGGSWYIVYNESELGENVKSINSGINFAGGPCASCSRMEAINWDMRNRYLEVYPFKTSDTSMLSIEQDPELWDIDSNVYTPETNYGINLEISIHCDFTDFMIEQKSLFIDILHKQMAVDMLREMAFNSNVRINRNAMNSGMASKADILYELDGDSTSLKKSGLVFALDNAYKAVDLNTRGINTICLPCKAKGIRYKSI